MYIYILIYIHISGGAAEGEPQWRASHRTASFAPAPLPETVCLCGFSCCVCANRCLLLCFIVLLFIWCYC